MLTDLMVVDFTWNLSGLYCTKRLADLGAEVIRIEAYAEGDLGRKGRAGTAGETSLLPQRSANHRKRVGLNLRTPVGRELAFALAAQADVVVESFRPGVMHHLGLDYDSLVQANPGLIYCSITGYGQTGTMHQLGGHDLNIQAVSGFLAENCDSDGVPIVGMLPISHYACGLYGAEQICAALVQSKRRGGGSYLDIAAADLLADWLNTHAEMQGAQNGERDLFPLKGRINYQVYETADGRYVALAAPEEKYWLNFCHAVGRADWELLTDLRIAVSPEIYEEMKTLFLTRTQAEWSELGAEVDCCLTAVEEMDMDHGHVHAVSWYGEDTYEVLRQKLQCSEKQMKQYAQNGIIP